MRATEIEYQLNESLEEGKSLVVELSDDRHLHDVHVTEREDATSYLESSSGETCYVYQATTGDGECVFAVLSDPEGGVLEIYHLSNKARVQYLHLSGNVRRVLSAR